MDTVKNLNCEGCLAECCRYVTIEIDAPESLEDFEDIKWYVLHKNVNVFVDEDNVWHAEFLTPCENLSYDGKCIDYVNRPKVCIDYSHDECTFHNDYEERYSFKTSGDVESYINNIFEKGLHIMPEKKDELTKS